KACQDGAPFGFDKLHLHAQPLGNQLGHINIKAIKLVGFRIDEIKRRIGAFNAYDQSASLFDRIKQIGSMSTAGGKRRESRYTCGKHAAHKTREFHFFAWSKMT